MYLIYDTYKKFYDVNDGISDHKKNIMKYFTFLTAFTLEDYGQVFLQFYYYERYQTGYNSLTIVNGIFMNLLSLKSMFDLANSSTFKRCGTFFCKCFCSTKMLFT